MDTQDAACSSLWRPVPLREELPEKRLQKLVPFFGEPPAGCGLHAVLQQQEFLVEMVDCRPRFGFVGGEVGVQLGRMIRVIHQPAEVAAEREGAGDANRAERVQPIGILHAAALQRGHRSGDSGAFVGHAGDDLAHPLDDRVVSALTPEPFPRGVRAGVFIAAVKLPVGDVVQQRGQFAEFDIGSLGLGEKHGVAAHAVDVPPIVAGGIFLELFPYKVGGAGDEDGKFGHDLIQRGSTLVLLLFSRCGDNKTSPVRYVQGMQFKECPMSATLESNVRTTREWTLGDLYERFGSMPFDRIRQHPTPGTATEDDVLDIHGREHRLCELVDGILVEKTMGQYESMLAVRICILLGTMVKAHHLGEVFGADGFMKLKHGLIRIPDVAFVSKMRLKQAKLRPWGKIQPLVPELAVEVLSPGNTNQEMESKLKEYFDAGVQLVWYIDPRVPQVTVYRGNERGEVLTPPADLTGDPVLPGLTISLAELFAPPEED